MGRRKLERYFLFGFPANTDEPSEPGAMLARGEMGRRQRQIPWALGPEVSEGPRLRGAMRLLSTGQRVHCAHSVFCSRASC